ncbi:probable glucuronosyltransferase [Coccomyxa sp. Obi]|nr:probable glucuronosyltransferase [Coccomyxa sp. Obi]
MSASIRNSIILTHWGLIDNEVRCDMSTDIRMYGCWMRNAGLWKEHHLPCFVPGEDTVVASTAGDYDNMIAPFGHQVRWDKQHKLFFAGGVRFDDVSYSHGVRQTLMLLFKDTPGFKLIDTGKEGGYGEYMADFGQSLFCLALTGAGWGVRLKLALMHGCIPVIITDHVQMPYEDVLPYPDFAVHIREHALFRLPEVLDAIIKTEGQVRRMQINVSCVWRYFTWRDPQARALDALICSLRRKMTGGRLIPSMDWSTCTLHCDAV